MDIFRLRFRSSRIFLSAILLSYSCLSTSGQLLRKSIRSRDQPQAPPQNDVQPTTPPPQLGTCPCVRPAGGGACIAYNQRYQAATLEEVVTDFVDLTNPDPSTALNVFGQKPYLDATQANSKQNSLQCKSLECVACYHVLSERLIQQLGPTESASLGIVPLPSFAPQVVGNGLNNAALIQHCPRLQHSQQQQQPQQQPSKSTSNGSKKAAPRPPTSGSAPAVASGPSSAANPAPSASANGASVPVNGGAATNTAGGGGPASVPAAPGLAGLGGGLSAAMVPDDAAWLILGELNRDVPTTRRLPPPIPTSTVATTTSNSSWENATTTLNGTSPTARYSYYSSTTTSPKRNKRGSGNAPPGSSASGSLGTTTPLDCSYKKGDLLDDNSGYVGLCNLCWSLRTLSPKYFPRYINELSCDQSDNGCLKGQGKCRERYRSIDVLYNYGTDAAPKWQQYSVNSPVACECQVLSGTTLHDLISK